MTTTELQERIEHLEKCYAKKGRKLERAKTNLAEALEAEKAQKAEKQSSDLVIEIGGLRFAKVNLGTDLENPRGRHYTHEEALEACPKGWRLPTNEEHKQLVERTRQKVITRDGIKGMLFTDKETGAEMFLPIAGLRNYASGALASVGNYAYYWSSSYHSTYYSYNLGFNYSGSVAPSSAYGRSYGFPVRCVRE